MVWQETTLGTLLRIKHGFAFRGEFFRDTGPAILLTPGNFKAEGGLKLKGDKEKYYVGPIPDEFVLAEGDMIVAMTDLTQNAPILGSAAIVPESGRFLHNQRLGKVVDVNSRLATREFVYYLFNSEAVRAQIRATATGATVRHTAPERIYSVRVALPPLPVQRRIASILSAYDDLIENCERRIRVLDEMARSLYREWFVHFRYPGHETVPLVDSPMGRIPKGWEIRKLGEILELHYGRALTAKDRRGGPVPVYASSGVVGWHDECLAKGPGVVLGRKGNVGSVFWSDSDFFVIDTAYYVTSDLPLRFIYFELQGKNFINSDAAVPGLSRQQAYALPTVVPPYQLLEKFDALVERYMSGGILLRRRTENLRQTRNLLLPRLLSGQLSVEEVE